MKHFLLATLFALAPAFAAGAQTVPKLTELEAFAAFDAESQSGLSALQRADDLLAADNVQARLELARVALREGQPTRAIELLQPLESTLKQTDPRLSRALWLLAQAWENRGNRAEARKVEITALQSMRARLGPQNPQFHKRVEMFREKWKTEVPADQLQAFVEWLLQPPTYSAQAGQKQPDAVTVWYGTNRSVDDPGDPATHYSGRIGELDVGQLVVTIPPNHRPGQIERPSAWSLTGRQDPMSHVILSEIRPLAHAAFAEGCCAAEDRLLFIHGYNVSFHDGALRAAQLSYDLEFIGETMYYSWPSRGSLLGYLIDANNVVATRPALTTFLEMATRGTGKLHIIAHSMGNRYMLEALEIFLRDYPDRRIGQLMLAAPDVDRLEFKTRFPVLRDQADKVTLYTSDQDIALQVSHVVNGRTRAGDAEVPLTLEGLDTVDASSIEADLLGHSYFGDAPHMLADILGLVRHGWSPENRCSVQVRAYPVWEVANQGCQVDSLRTASDLLARYEGRAIEVALTRQSDANAEDRAFWASVVATLKVLRPG